MGEEMVSYTKVIYHCEDEVTKIFICEMHFSHARSCFEVLNTY